MDGITVTITGPEGAEIRYTTNGYTPTVESSLYSTRFYATSGTTIKAIAILDGVSSSVASYVVPSVDDEPGGDDH